MKYEMQYHQPLQGEIVTMPTLPTSMDIGIYEAMDDLDGLDLKLQYLFENVPHHQDQIQSPWKLRDGTSWYDMLPILDRPSGSPKSGPNRLLTIIEHSTEQQEPREQVQRNKGKRQITDEFSSPPTSPHVLNVGYGTLFKSSSQFFTRPGGLILLPPETMSQQNVLLGLALPHTPAFKNIIDAGDPLQPRRGGAQM